ncbi:riboflavin synthase [Gilvimarinus algae]|uniref:Riboflavin synthase n=1 Tax=Gilvimarinus algae TaxID=3058037 RepID=A0ABT8TDI6_9GAMM|nr:riboflavin synthase [Gilvimarinus sp. SDUM040014]MDO3381178.1 riboflavin synthase [Gilvimarinus sp. SDUM040014]
MFTGIIEAVGEVAAVTPASGDVSLYLRTGKLDLADVSLGGSVATNGVCLTVVDLPGDGFRADVSRESLSLTTIEHWQTGQPVNLEKALLPTTRLGGHIVSGHVDGVGEVIGRHSDGRSERFRLRAPEALARYIAHKGSITVDGISLTVNKVEGAEFELNIVPHTLAETIMGSYRPGTLVNLEVDVLARYLERLLAGESKSGKTGMTMEFLTENGFNK